jgi:single-stranded-DNA-specific exonuclease
LGKELGISPITARILVNRGMTTLEEMRSFLNANEQHDPSLLKDGEKAAEILYEKIQEGKKIRVIGDYDIDGVSASYILYRGIKKAGGDVDVRIPDRIRDGYGLNFSLIQNALRDGVDTVITCDNGISALDEIAHGKAEGLTVIVTDHHDIPFDESDGERVYRIPEADAVVDPKQEDCPYPYKKLCGAAVAWKLIILLYRKAGLPDWEADEFLENVGFATVGDVMDLDGENRCLVRVGLDRLNKTNNLGMRALIEETGLFGKAISLYHVGFILGPCINAAGRLDLAMDAFELLMAEDERTAKEKAVHLRELNEERKDMTNRGVEAADEIIGGKDLKEKKVLVIYLPDCHESVAGIVAGKVREKYNHPVFILTKGKDGLKGSGRSIEEYSMYEELTKVKHLLTRFGGHPMAAGISLEREHLEELELELNRNVSLKEEDFRRKIRFDAVPLSFAFATEELALEFERLEPFGNGNPTPLFAMKGVMALRAQLVGKNKNICRCLLMSGDTTLTGVCFQDGEEFYELAEKEVPISIIFSIQLNEFRGERNVQAVISSFRSDL